MTLICVDVFTDPDDPSNPTKIHVADLKLENSGQIIIHEFTQGHALVRLRAAISEIESKEYLDTREAQARIINGEEVQVSTKVKIPRHDERYPWAVSDQLNKKYGFLCRVHQR